MTDLYDSAISSLSALESLVLKANKEIEERTLDGNYSGAIRQAKYMAALLGGMEIIQQNSKHVFHPETFYPEIHDPEPPLMKGLYIGPAAAVNQQIPAIRALRKVFDFNLKTAKSITDCCKRGEVVFVGLINEHSNEDVAEMRHTLDQCGFLTEIVMEGQSHYWQHAAKTVQQCVDTMFPGFIAR